LVWLSNTTILGMPGNHAVGYTMICLGVVYALSFFIAHLHNFRWYRKLFRSTSWLEVTLKGGYRRSRIQRLLLISRKRWISSDEYERKRYKYEATGAYERASRRQSEN